MHYSASRNAFYLTSSRAQYESRGSWPADAVEIEKAEHDKYIGSPPEGMQLGADKNGRPTWVAKDAASFDDLVSAALRRINAGYTQAMAAILVEYPDDETRSFDKQESEARTWSEWQEVGGTEPATPYLDAMLAERPIGKGELVTRILAKADAFVAAHGAATGRRQRLEDDIKAARQAEDRAALEAIDW